MSYIIHNLFSCFRCDFSSYLEEIENDWKGQGYCYCQKVRLWIGRYRLKLFKILEILQIKTSLMLYSCSFKQCKAYPHQHLAFPNVCPEENRQCVQWYPNYPNQTVGRFCNETVPCADCKSVSFVFIIII